MSNSQRPNGSAVREIRLKLRHFCYSTDAHESLFYTPWRILCHIWVLTSFFLSFFLSFLWLQAALSHFRILPFARLWSQTFFLFLSWRSSSKQSPEEARSLTMDDIFTQCREGNSVAVRLWLDNTENDLNLGWDIRSTYTHRRTQAATWMSHYLQAVRRICCGLWGGCCCCLCVCKNHPWSLLKVLKYFPWCAFFLPRCSLTCAAASATHQPALLIPV